MINNIAFSNIIKKAETIKGYNKEVYNILKNLRKDLEAREIEILEGIETIEKNTEVPSGYSIYSYYSNNGDWFEAGLTPSGYCITN